MRYCQTFLRLAFSVLFTVVAIVVQQSPTLAATTGTGKTVDVPPVQEVVPVRSVPEDDSFTTIPPVQDATSARSTATDETTTTSAAPTTTIVAVATTSTTAPAEVMSMTITRDAELAATGSQTSGLAIIGAGFLLAGLLCELVIRRRTSN